MVLVIPFLAGNTYFKVKGDEFMLTTKSRNVSPWKNSLIIKIVISQSNQFVFNNITK